MVASGIHRHSCSSTSIEITYLHIISAPTCFNVIYLCAPELKEDLDKEEAEKDDAQEEKKRSNQNDTQQPDSKEEEIPTNTVKPAGLCEYNPFISRLNMLIKVV